MNATNDDNFTTRWWWIRHAPVTVNQGKIYGQTDLPCDCSDNELFKHAANMLPRPSVLITSDLQRTLQTAEAIRQQGYHDLPNAIKDVNLREQNLGDWQGQTRQQIGMFQRSLSERFWLTPEFEAAPNGESFSDLCSRTAKSILNHSQQHKGKDIICVSHNGTIRAALVLALNCAPSTAMRFVINNVSITRMDYIKQDNQTYWRVCTINDIPSNKGWKSGIDHVSE